MPQRRLPVQLDGLLVGCPRAGFQVDLPGDVGIEISADPNGPVGGSATAAQPRERRREVLLSFLLRRERPSHWLAPPHPRSTRRFVPEIPATVGLLSQLRAPAM